MGIYSLKSALGVGLISTVLRAITVGAQPNTRCATRTR